MSVMKEINHRGYTAEICLDTDAQNPLEFSSWYIHVFWNEVEVLGTSIEWTQLEDYILAAINNNNDETKNALIGLAGFPLEDAAKYSCTDAIDTIKEQGKYLVYYLDVMSFMNSDPLVVKMTDIPFGANGIIYIELDSADGAGYWDESYEKSLANGKEMAQAVLNEWLAWQNDEMLCTYISDSEGDNVEILGGLLTMEEAIDESIRLIDELRDRELLQLAKTNPEAAVISLVRERGSKDEIGLHDSGNFVYRASLERVLDTLKPLAIPKSDWYVITKNEIIVYLYKTKVTAIKELTTALTTNFTTYKKEDDE